MRVAALQDWPVFAKQKLAPRATAASTSVSLNTRFGDLPPSSSDTVLTVSAAALLIRMPARVEPVNDTTSISGCEDRIVPTPGPSPLTMLKTPAGTPASCMISAKRMLDIGAISDGFSTIVHPAASAAPTFSTTWFIGQFQGVIRPATPAASNTRSWPSVPGRIGRCHSNASSARMNAFRWLRPAPAWSLSAMSMGAPISIEIASAISTARAS